MTEQRHISDEEIDALLEKFGEGKYADHSVMLPMFASIIRQLRQRIGELEAEIELTNGRIIQRAAELVAEAGGEES